MTVAQYLARLAAEAVTIINAEDYGRAVYDLALRRSLITIGEDMVNIAYDAPLDMPPQNQIEDAERRLFELAETGRYDGGFQSFNDAVALAIRNIDGYQNTRCQNGWAAIVRPYHSGRSSRYGQNIIGNQYCL